LTNNCGRSVRCRYCLAVGGASTGLCSDSFPDMTGDPFWYCNQPPTAGVVYACTEESNDPAACPLTGAGAAPTAPGGGFAGGMASACNNDSDCCLPQDPNAVNSGRRCCLPSRVCGPTGSQGYTCPQYSDNVCAGGPSMVGPTISDPCRRNTNCAQCTPNGSCGWCASTGTCLTGSQSGPSTGGCPGGWAWLPAQCGGVAAPTPQPPRSCDPDGTPCPYGPTTCCSGHCDVYGVYNTPICGPRP
jgi:hypothetical protein